MCSLADKEKKKKKDGLKFSLLCLTKPRGFVTTKPGIFQRTVLSVFMVSFFHDKGTD